MCAPNFGFGSVKLLRPELTGGAGVGFSRSAVAFGSLRMAVGNACDDVWYNMERFQLDHISEVITKLEEGEIDDEIWGKIIVMERGRRVAKAYLRKTTIIVDGGAEEFDGQTLGFNQFNNPFRDDYTDELRCKIGDGVIIKMDNQGNIKAMARGSTPIIVQGTAEPELNCISERLTRDQGRLKTRREQAAGAPDEERIAKIFDMRRFKSAIVREMGKSNPNGRELLMKTCVRIALVKDGGSDPMKTPCWFMIINLVALDMLSTKVPRALNFLARCAHTDLSGRQRLSKMASLTTLAPPASDIITQGALKGLITAALQHANDPQVYWYTIRSPIRVGFTTAAVQLSGQEAAESLSTVRNTHALEVAKHMPSTKDDRSLFTEFPTSTASSHSPVVPCNPAVNHFLSLPPEKSVPLTEATPRGRRHADDGSSRYTKSVKSISVTYGDERLRTFVADAISRKARNQPNCIFGMSNMNGGMQAEPVYNKQMSETIGKQRHAVSGRKHDANFEKHMNIDEMTQPSGMVYLKPTTIGGPKISHHLPRSVEVSKETSELITQQRYELDGVYHSKPALTNEMRKRGPDDHDEKIKRLPRPLYRPFECDRTLRVRETTTSNGRNGEAVSSSTGRSELPCKTSSDFIFRANATDSLPKVAHYGSTKIPISWMSRSQLLSSTERELNFEVERTWKLLNNARENVQEIGKNASNFVLMGNRCSELAGTQSLRKGAARPRSSILPTVSEVECATEQWSANRRGTWSDASLAQQAYADCRNIGTMSFDKSFCSYDGKTNTSECGDGEHITRLVVD
ncbi:unnamed protein product [Toxocara canis]|uniref:MH2 domain-containing protein n=1 Tax=Toxocara canis TaxID=6265 RepID=A0A183UEJ0_TOXCA|nr:unnamed protein product [Toxocara canis]